MKHSFFSICIGILLAFSAVSARQPVSPEPGKTLTVSGTRFTYPLVQRWISDFTRQNPGVQIRLVSPRDTAAEHADVRIVAAPLQAAQQQAGTEYVSVARYALLPVANSKNVYAQGKPVSVKELRRLYFDDESAVKTKNGNPAANQNVTVYNRLEKACAPVTFAAFYGETFENIKGRSVVGDDQHLLKAVQKDEKAISFNNPGFIYDLQTRRPVEHVSIIPIDLNSNGKLDTEENFYYNLDQLIQRLETAAPPDIPVADVIFYYNRELENSKPWLKAWIQYIQHKGQAKLHAFGFLQPTGQSLANRNK